jgi:decaprenyl-phosphate phosphoribosyltransferase
VSSKADEVATQPTLIPQNVEGIPLTRSQRGSGWSIATGLLRAVRPKQWIKNVLVLAAPAAAGIIYKPKPLLETLVAFVAFTGCAAAGYLLNDVRDVVADRAHPAKRLRPMAAGDVPLELARTVAVVLACGSLGLAATLCGWQLTVVLALYLTATAAYSFWLKRSLIIEMMIVASGFLLRAISGAAATHVSLSRWFMIVAGFGSLYMVVGKRYAEVTTLGEGARVTRQILSQYPPAFLRQTRELCASVTLIAYCLWAFEQDRHDGSIWSELSILPVTLALMRYALLLERGQGGAPEDVVFGDRTLLVAGASWVALFAVSVITGGTH